MAASLAGTAGENIGVNQRRPADRLAKIILEARGEMERRLLRDAVCAVQEFLGAGPANLDAAEEVGPRPGHLEDAFGLELRLRSENLRARPEPHLCPSPIGGAADLC